MLAAIRPDDWNYALLLHVLGAMLLVGGLTTAVAAQALAWRPGGASAALAYARVEFRALLLVALPGWVLMRIAGQWIASKEGFDGGDPAWLGIGYATSEGGGVLLLVSIVLAGLGARRLRRTASEGSALNRAAGIVAGLLVVAYVVTVWAMTTKPD